MSRRGSSAKLLIVIGASSSDEEQSPEDNRPNEPDVENMPVFFTPSPQRRRPPKRMNSWRQKDLNVLYELAHSVLNTLTVCKGVYGNKFAEEILQLATSEFRRRHGTASGVRSTLSRYKRSLKGRTLERAYEAKFAMSHNSSANSRHNKWKAGLTTRQQEQRTEKNRLYNKAKRMNETKEHAVERKKRDRLRHHKQRAYNAAIENKEESRKMLLKRIVNCTRRLSELRNSCVDGKDETARNLAKLLTKYGRVACQQWISARTAEAEHGRTRSRLTFTRRVRIEYQAMITCQGFSHFLEDFSHLLAHDQPNSDSTNEALAKSQQICDIARTIRSACEAEIFPACEQLRLQLTTGVHHHGKVNSAEEKTHRTVCRVPYHVVDAKTPGAQSLTKLYPRLYRSFMDLPEEAVEHQGESEHDRQVMVQLTVEFLMMVVERAARGELVAVTTDQAPDAENAVFGYEESEAIQVEEESDGQQCENRGIIDEGEEARLVVEGEELLIQDPTFRDDAGPHGATYAPRCTYAMECNGDCHQMSGAEAVKLQKILLALITEITHKKYDGMDQFERTSLPYLKKCSACYTGLRSVLARFHTLRALVMIIKIVEHSFRNPTEIFAKSIKRKAWNWLPKAVRFTIESSFSNEENAKKHSQSAAYATYGKEMEIVAKKVSETESEFCEICNRAREPSQMVHRTAFKRKMPNLNDDEMEVSEQNEVSYCKTCMTDARQGNRTDAERKADPKIPRYSASNNVDCDEVPDELQGLNWIEKSIIQLSRPVRAVYCLNDAGGQKTSMLSTGGPMVILPVPTEGTLTHVCETLPSEAGLTISVTPEAAKSKLVRLPKVLKALRWLKANNPLYKDITIDPSFTFTTESVIFVKKPANTMLAANLASLITDEEDHPSLLRHEDVTPQVIRPMHGQRPPGLAHEQYTLRPNPYEPAKVDTPDLDMKCFPYHFPKGRFGYSFARPREMTIREMVKWWLACKDRRFAQDPQFLAFLHGLLEQKDMTAALGLQSRMNRGHLHGEAFLNAITEGTADFEGSLHTSAKSMRGHVSYWDEKKKEARAHIAIFGPMTFFLTLNPAERHWVEVIDLYQKIYGKGVTAEQVYQYIAKDPYWFARCFQQRLRAIFTLLLLSGNGPLGKIIHHFIRIEYQHRGTQHAHCLLWVEGAPTENSTDDEKIEFIDNKVVARLPDRVLEPELFEIVNTYQKHYEHHSKTCSRSYRVAGKIMWKCRFEFPRPSTPRTIVSKATDRLHALPGSRIKKYYLSRRPCDVWVNDYNPVISLVWKGNTDLQYIFNGSNEVVAYTTGYTTKSERSKDQANVALREASNSKEGFRAMVDCMTMRQSGVLEVVDTIMGHPLCTFDAGHININSNVSQKRDRMMKSTVQIKAEVARGEKKYAFVDNQMDTYYPGRAKELEAFSFLNISTHFQVLKEQNVKCGDRKNASSSDDPFAPHFHVHCRASPMFDHDQDTRKKYPITGSSEKKVHVLLGRPLVPRFFWPNLESANDEAREDYYRRLCFVFIPWRNEDALLPENCDLYEVRWSEYIKQLEVDEPQAAIDIKKIIAHQEALLEQDRDVTERRKAARELLNSLRIDDDAEDEGQEVFDRNVDDAAHDAAVINMNAGQKQQYDEIIAHVRAQNEYKVQMEAIRKAEDLSAHDRAVKIMNLGPKKKPLLRVIVGTAGCGKSFLINAIADELTVQYTTPETRASQPAVLLAAPTGLAAVQIRGSTLHSLLGIEVQHGQDQAMRPLSGMRLNQLRLQMRNARLLIVDELSMMSAVVLAKVHMRLMEICGNKELFGGIDVLLFGDLLQLPPVLAPAIFESLKAKAMNRLYGSMLPEMCLFDQFDYAELVENMRQAGDKEFGDMLQRLRIQALTDSDVEALSKRIIKRNDDESAMQAAARFYDELIKSGVPAPMALFGTNKEVKEFNQLTIERLKLTCVVVEAEDSSKRKAGRDKKSEKSKGEKGRHRRVYQDAEYDIGRPTGSTRRPKRNELEKKEEDDTNKAAGLEKHLLLAENGRVMLRRNVNPALGLVNGATGVLTSIVKTPDTEEVVALKISFDGLTEHLIEKQSATFDINEDEQLTRRQFPVSMAFGATVHKAQGMTLPAALVCTANFFVSAPAQAFVALSRVRTIDDLHLLDLHPEKMRCSLVALRKYNSLRTNIGLPPFAEPIPKRRWPQLPQEQPEAAGKPVPSKWGRSKARLRVTIRGNDCASAEEPPVKQRRTSKAEKMPKAMAKARVGVDNDMDESIEEEWAASGEESLRGAESSQEFVYTARTTRSLRGDAKAAVPTLALGSDTLSRRDNIAVDPALVLRNSGTDCFIIGPVNLVHSVAPLRDAILEIAPILEAAGSMTPRMRELASLLRGEQNDVSGLRRACAFPPGQGDARDALFPLLQDFSESYDELCKTTRSVTLICAAGHRTQMARESHNRHILTAQKLPDRYTKGTIEDIYGRTLAHDEICHCTGQMAEAQVDVQMEGSLLVVQIDRTSLMDNGERVDRILGLEKCNAARMLVFGTPMRMLACIQHLANEGGDGGHYVVWRRADIGWTVIDDARPIRKARQLPGLLANIHIIIFQKI